MSDESLVNVNHEGLRKVMRTCWKSNLPLFVWGETGIGKSQEVRKLTEELGVGMRDVRISQLDPSDLRGLPRFNDKNETEWAKPKWLPEEGEGILFLDELNLAPPSIQKACYQLILDRKIGSYELPEGWVVFAAGNRMEDRANVFEMAGPLRDRLCQVELGEPSVDDWVQWAAEERDIHPDIAAFLKWQTEYLHTFFDNEDASVFATPRSWAEYVNKLIENSEEIDKDIIGCAVGRGIAKEFMSFRKLHNKIDLQKLLDNPEQVKEINKTDELYCLVSALSSKYKRDRSKLEDIMRVANNFDNAEYGILLGRMLKNKGEHFKTDFKKLDRKGSKVIKEFTEKYMKYLTDEEIKNMGD